MSDTLLSFDTEFTHPSPSCGACMQIGLVAMPFDKETMTVKGRARTFKALLRTFDHARMDTTAWVKENQADLYARSCALPLSKHLAAVVKLKSWLRGLRGDVIPCGWVLGSDIAYLLDLLGTDNELVHYSALDLKPMAIALTGQWEIGDKELAKFLGVKPIDAADEHDALSDALYQSRLIRAALTMSRSSRLD